jgi:hypothetical protein
MHRLNQAFVNTLFPPGNLPRLRNFVGIISWPSIAPIRRDALTPLGLGQDIEPPAAFRGLLHDALALWKR